MDASMMRDGRPSRVSASPAAGHSLAAAPGQRAAARPPGDFSSDLDTGEGDAGVFLSPRVIDQRAMGHLSKSLRELVEGARAQSLQLQSTVEQAAALDDDVASASRQLHERLSLSARMLKAFQSQIDRIDGLLETANAGEERVTALHEKMQQRITDFETRLEKYLERFDARLDDMVSRASKRFQEDVSQYEASMNRAQEALPSVEARMAELQERVRDAEERAGSADRSLAGTLERAGTAEAGLRADIQRATTLATRTLQDIHATCERLHGQLESAGRAGNELDGRTALARNLATSLNHLERTRGEVAQLLGRIEPLMPLLQDEERFAADRIRHAAELMRAGLRQELSDMAGGLRRLAEQAASAAGGAAKSLMPPMSPMSGGGIGGAARAPSSTSAANGSAGARPASLAGEPKVPPISTFADEYLQDMAAAGAD